MIDFLSLRELDINKYDAVWLIVRSAKNCSKLLENANVKQVAELSPSFGLFKKYLDLRNKSLWNHQTFLDVYVPEFLREAKLEPKFADRLLELKANPDKKYALVCFCSDERECHRSIVAALCHINNIAVNTKYNINQYIKEYWSSNNNK